jgi:hypothetical protein
MTPGTNRRRSIFGAVDLASGRFFYQIARKAVSATFIAFLEQLPQAYPAAPVVAVICDNVIIHRSKLVKRWLATTPGCGCCTKLAPAPRQPGRADLGGLKAWLANSPTLTIQGRVRQVHAFFWAGCPAQILATTTPRSSPWLPQGYGQNFQEAA